MYPFFVNEAAYYKEFDPSKGIAMMLAHRVRQGSSGYSMAQHSRDCDYSPPDCCLGAWSSFRALCWQVEKTLEALVKHN